MSNHEMDVRFVVAGAVVTYLTLGSFSTAPIAAQPNSNPIPTAPEEICGPCIIYGVPVPGQSGVPSGVYQIDTCTGAVHLTEVLAGATNLGVASPTSLYVADNTPIPTLYLDYIPIVAPPAPVGIASGGAMGMGEGGMGTQFDVDLFGVLVSLIPQPPVVVGVGMINGTPVSYPGDIALSPSTCHILSSVDDGTLTGTYAWVRVRRSDGSLQVLNPNCASFIGLAFDGARRLWGDIGAGGVVQVSEVSGIPTGLAVPTFFNGTNVAWLDLASNPCNSCSTEIETDLGDAPDSTNHFQNTPMTAYVGVLASFPTVFDPLTGAPQGPIHLRATEDAWLGASVSDENEADLPPDQDMATNLTPPVDISNQDGFDDGAAGTVFLPQCQPANINYTITVAGPVRTRYTNLWIDFNRDGDWADSLTCLDGQGQALSVPEWAIQNQTSNLGPGQYNLVTPPFISYSPSPPISAWMRLSLTDAPNLGADGRGQSGGYEYGETEDFLMVPTATANEYVLQ